MIEIKNEYLRLDTENTTYLMKILPTGHVENVYYGSKFAETDYAFIEERNLFGCGPVVTAENYAMYPDSKSLEYSTRGRGDFREPSILVNCDGDSVNEFLFEKVEKIENFHIPGFPQSDGKTETLMITLRDKAKKLAVRLYYSLTDGSDVIVKSAALTNEGDSEVVIERFASAQLDVCGDDFLVDTLNGYWAKERQINTTKLAGGVTKVDSNYGFSSAERNPYVVLKKPDCGYSNGICYGFNLIYSGNHATYLDKSLFGKVRIINGINDVGFSWKLGAGETFYTPESTVCFSDSGTNGLTCQYHSFINNHIVRGYWRNRVRPIICNNWEATRFDISEEIVLRIAKRAKALGAELFVLDDGWFGKRTDNTKGLGDWYENRDRLPEGLDGLCKKLNAIGLDFGIWVEPEMVNPDSDLYRAHPDWVVANPNYTPLLHCSQYVLDLCNEEVRKYIIDSMTRVFTSTNITYVKWDCNRNITECYSPTLIGRQKEFSYRYMLGLYSILQTLTDRFPNILFESCASGGNRVDMGMLYYTPQFWTSDNTDFFDRVKIQEGTLTCYPQSAMGAHVSASPNGHTLRASTIENRFNTACIGAFGYEMDLTKISDIDTKAVMGQIEWYKKYRKTLQFGDYYRLKSVFYDTHASWVVVSKDKTQAVANITNKIQELYCPQVFLKVCGLKPDSLYEIKTRVQYLPVKKGDKFTATQQACVARTDEDAIVAAKACEPLQSECEKYVVSGRTLDKIGIRLNTEWMGGGDPNITRIMYDFGSRLYSIDILQDK